MQKFRIVLQAADISFSRFAKSAAKMEGETIVLSGLNALIFIGEDPVFIERSFC